MIDTNIFARTGDYIVIQKGSNKKYYYLESSEFLPSYVFGQNNADGIETFGTVASGESTDPIEVKDLRPNSKHLYQVVFGFSTPVTFYRWNVTTERLGGTDERRSWTSSFREIAYWNMFMSPFHHPSKETMTWINKENYPGFSVYNQTSKSWEPKIKFIGMMFEAMEVKDTAMIDSINKGRIPVHLYNIGALPDKLAK